MGLRGRENLVGEHFFFATTTVVRWARVFTGDKYCEILVRNIKHYQQRYHFVIHGYVIMPSHFHWIVQVEPEQGTISGIMRDIKKHTAWDVMEELEIDGRTDLLELFEAEAAGFPTQRRRFWNYRFDDIVVRNQSTFHGMLFYIHQNPVKAGLVQRTEDYKYSSARNYILGDHSVLYVDTGMLGIPLWNVP